MEPFYSDDLTTIYNGDCIEVMNSLENEIFDAVITDPPYNTTKCKWDVMPDFEVLWTLLKSLGKETTPFILFGIEPFSSKLRVSNLSMFRYDWYWQKDKGANFLFGNKQPLKVIEIASVFYQKQPVYNPQKEINPKGSSKRHLSKNPSKISKNVKDVMGDSWKETEMDSSQNYFGKNYEPDKLLPKQLIYFPREQRGKVHPTQKPVALMEYLIKTYTNENDIILDPYMGSGTTLVAAKKLNRRAIGIELSEEYCNFAVERLRMIHTLF